MVDWRPSAAPPSRFIAKWQNPRPCHLENFVATRPLDAAAKSGRDHQRLAERRPLMKTLNPLKVPFGTAKGVCLRNVRYLQWEDAFEVDFQDGLTFLEPHATIRNANKI